MAIYTTGWDVTLVNHEIIIMNRQSCQLDRWSLIERIICAGSLDL